MDYELAEFMVRRIVDDLSDRRGLSGAWDAIDYETREEICNEWARLIVDEAEQYSKL